jgi:hypothetical protein
MFAATILAASLGFVAPAATAAPAASTAAACSTAWGSKVKEAGPATHREYVTGLRSGKHTCFDRLVFEVTGDQGDYSGHRVAYEKVYYLSGKPVTFKGGGTVLHISIKAGGHSDNGVPTISPKTVNRTFPGYTTFRELKMASDHAGQVDFALKVKARLPMKVWRTVASNGKNLTVIDVAHHW